MLNVLTYNIQFGKKLSQILHWLTTLKPFPDIICLQEFPLDKQNELMKLSNLTGNKSVCVESMKIKNNSYGQVTIYNSTKLNIVKHTDVNLGNTRLEKILSRQHNGRNAMIARFTYKNKEFDLINTHLTAIHLNKTRRKQIHVIMNSINSKSEMVSTIFLGDLNYSSLLRQSRLIDLMKEYGFDNAFSIKTHKLFFLRHQLDYVFYKKCSVLKPEVLKINYSDHYPVKFELKV
ncbi:MAG: endonuclease/exonuclease/phosphatase family protein [bacterium]|nr:endonuclease/exonuclease/phosphatase family protein [bacterium]